jgi:hypothetical protein
MNKSEQLTTRCGKIQAEGSVEHFSELGGSVSAQTGDCAAHPGLVYLFCAFLNSKENKTGPEEDQRPVSDLLFDSGSLHLRIDAETRFKHQDLSYHSCE